MRNQIKLRQNSKKGKKKSDLLSANYLVPWTCRRNRWPHAPFKGVDLRKKRMIFFSPEKSFPFVAAFFATTLSRTTRFALTLKIAFQLEMQFFSMTQLMKQVSDFEGNVGQYFRNHWKYKINKTNVGRSMNILCFHKSTKDNFVLIQMAGACT